MAGSIVQGKNKCAVGPEASLAIQGALSYIQWLAQSDSNRPARNKYMCKIFNY